jgi:hypothetical protein
MRLGMPTRSTEHGMFGSSDVEVISSDTSDEGEDRQRTRTATASRKRRRAKENSELENEDAEVTVVKAKRRRRQSPRSEASEDDGLRLPRSRRLTVTRRQRTLDEDEEEEQTPPRSQRRRTATQPTFEEDEAEETPPPSKRRKRSRRKATSSGEDEPLKISRRTIDQNEDIEGEEDEGQEEPDDNGEEKEDLDEDLAFLRSSPLPNRGKLRSAHEKPKSERQLALEALKKRRAGTNEPSSSSTPGRSRRIVVESESDSELEIINEEPENDSDVLSDPENAPKSSRRIFNDADEEDEDVEDDEEEQEPARDANALDMFLADENDENFIDDEEVALIGEPILGPEEILPLVFSRLASAKPKELFQYAIEWMVMKKIHPAFDASSQVYRITLQKLDDEVKGLANSKFSSSIWTPDFTRAIRARPDLMISEISKLKGEITDAYCEACNRKNHPACDEVMLSGAPYDAETLEPLHADSSDSDSNSDDTTSSLSADLNGEKPTYNAHGERLPPESRRFTLGSTCSANAQVAHTLHHWRYHLYSWVKDYLAREGHLTAEMLVKRDQWSDRKREKAALKIVKSMEESGEIRKLYALYKEQVKYAVELQNDRRNMRWGK